MAEIISYEEEYVLNSRGMKLFTCTWLPTEQSIKALVFLCHGYAMELCMTMEETGLRLAKCGFAVYGIEYEGHGRSEGLHGYIPSFKDLVDDCITFFDQISGKKDYKNKRRFLVGESMGGAVALSIHKQQPASWDGAVLVAPMCKIADELKPHPTVIRILSKLTCIVPTWKIVPTKDILEIGYQDPIKRKQIKGTPRIYQGRPRLKTAHELLMASIEIEKTLDEMKLPLLIIHGEDDVVTDKSISRLLYEKAQSQDKTLKIYPSMWHGLLSGETHSNTQTVFSDIIWWLQHRTFIDIN